MRLSVLFVLCFTCFATCVATSLSTSKIHPLVHSKLSETGSANIFISLQGGIDTVLKKFSTQSFDPKQRTNRIQAVITSLKENAQVSQKGVMDYFNKSKMDSSRFESFWISNQVFVANADYALVERLSKFEKVAKIELEQMTKLPDSPVAVSSRHQSNEVTWGLENIKASNVWEMPAAEGGNAGEGVTVAIIDSGVSWTHESLYQNYRGNYGWYDPYTHSISPNDQNGHGTHVAGTIVGNKLGIGVAPNATWIACKNCNELGQCFQQASLACAQFVTCPTLPNGLYEDCSKAPQIASNSWGEGQGQLIFQPVIAAWHAVGIIPVFASGNEGPDCGTVGSPGDLPSVIAVGATMENNRIASFSSRGPSVNGVLKPDISAPGYNILSASNTVENGYTYMNGTSMATPHVSGVIILMKSAYPDLTYEEIKIFLYKGAVQDYVSGGESCGGVSDTVYPNNIYGQGRINALNTMISLRDEYVASSAAKVNLIGETAILFVSCLAYYLKTLA